MWLRSEGFVDRVKLWQSSNHFQVSPNYILGCKLKALKTNLRAWNEEVFGNIGKKKQLRNNFFWLIMLKKGILFSPFDQLVYNSFFALFPLLLL
jgi:hypothetical protein